MVEKVRTAELGDSARDVAMLMNKYQIGCAIIVDDGKSVGIITERDMLKRVICKGITPEKVKAADIMTKPLVNAPSNMQAGDAAKIMLKWNIKKLPIVDDGRLVGLVTLTDLLRSEGVIETLNGCALNGVSKHLKKTISIYFDDSKQHMRKCPLMFKDGYSMGCSLKKCMWWTGDECAVTKLSRQVELEHIDEEEDEVSCITE
jgi:CBS-domain-containing membrane protein